VRTRLQREVHVAAPASRVWDYVTDWPRQGEWIPQTRVENVDEADHLGGRFRAWSGVGRLGFWDPMTITAWERTAGGGGRCEVLHLGAVVKGEGEFTVVAVGDQASRFVWAEVLVVPGGALGALAWRLVRPLVTRVVDRGLRAMRDRVESAGVPDPTG
jgi:carbon monoxide dehydrogenase subunit G